MSKALEEPNVREVASQFLDSDELGSIGAFVRSLESLYLSRSLDTSVDSHEEQNAEKLVKIALALESELFLALNGSKTEKFADAYYLIANVMEYAARVYGKAKKPSFEYWLRASIAYNYAGYSANSVFSAKQCDTLLTFENDFYNDIMRLVIHFLARRFKEFATLKKKIKHDLDSAIKVTDTVNSKQEYFLRVGLSSLVESVSKIIDYMINGQGEAITSWPTSSKRGNKLIEKAGDSLFSWIVSRFHYVFMNSIDRSLWSKNDMIPAKLISALTHNNESPIYELWPSQDKALRAMIVAESESKTRTIITMPTSAGKTLIAAIYLARELLRTNLNAFYVTPLRALVDEISEYFATYFQDLGLTVAYLPGDYDTIPQLEALVGRNARIFVLTPEKLDLLWRVNDSRLSSAGIFVFDEIQLIREEGRGVRLELLVSKINEAFKESARIILLSAVIPPSNIGEFAGWLGSNSTERFESNWSPTRIREGWFFRRPMGEREGAGDIMYFRNKSEQNPLLINDVLPREMNAKAHLDGARLAWKYQVHFGPVMVYANKKIETEKIAKMILDIARETEPTPTNPSLLEASHKVRHMLGTKFLLPDMLEYGIAYHHSNLPDEVKYVIQHLAKERTLKVVVCTTTLAEGVNLSIKSTIISDTMAGSQQMDGIKLINLAGRAGRALRDTEGHVIVLHRSMVDRLLDITKSNLRSRFFSYIQSLTEDAGLDTDTNAIEANLLARAYKKEISSKDLQKATLKLMKSTFFSRQAKTDEFRLAHDKVFSSASDVVREAEREDQAVLKVFAETGLGLSHCKILDQMAKQIADQNHWRLRASGEVNWPLLREVLKACVNASDRQFEQSMKTIVRDPLPILQGWLQGKTIMEISMVIDPQVATDTFSNISYFLFGYVAKDVAWAAAAFGKLLKHHAQNKGAALELDKEWDLLPSYLKYGTSNPSALLLIISHALERDDANLRAAEHQEVPYSPYDWVKMIGWASFVTANSPESFKRVKESLLSRLTQFSVPLNLSADEYDRLAFSPVGSILSGDREVVKLAPELTHLINAIKLFATYHIDFRLNDKRQWEMLVSIMPQ